MIFTDKDFFRQREKSRHELIERFASKLHEYHEFKKEIILQKNWHTD